MQPTTARDFLKVARQRLDVAIELLNSPRTRTLEAQYIGGYAVECSLKALILQRTPTDEQLAKLKSLTKGAENHRSAHLLSLLKGLGIKLTPDLARKMRRFDWTTDLRYEIGKKDYGETRALLKKAESIYSWVESQIA